MKTLIIIFLFIGIHSTSHAQIDFTNPPWKRGCDTLETQVELNMCHYQQWRIADSVLNSYYDKLIAVAESEYEAEKLKGTAKKDKEYFETLKEQRKQLIKSRKYFEELRNSTVGIISNKYKGGSIRSMMVNSYAFDMTVNQIKILTALLDEFGIK